MTRSLRKGRVEEAGELAECLFEPQLQRERHAAASRRAFYGDPTRVQRRDKRAANQGESDHPAA